MIGKYVINQYSSGVSNNIYYVIGINGRVYYYINIKNGNDLAYYNDMFVYGDSYGIRPVISLKPGTEYSEGDGSIDNPYLIG